MERLKKVFFSLAIIYLALLIWDILWPVILKLLQGKYADASFPEWGMLVLTLIALFFSLVEYHAHKKREKMAVFSEYSKRYVEDHSIKCVVEFLICYFENEKLEGVTPSIYQKEMFLRYFEELEFMIEKGKIDEDDIAEFFVYYAVAAAMCLPFVQGTELESDSSRCDVWRGYRLLVKRYYDKMSSGIIMDYRKHHLSSPDIKLIISLPTNK